MRYGAAPAPRLAPRSRRGAIEQRRCARPGTRRALAPSLNYVTSYDGFTLRDLVSYAGKHNEADGESKCDGVDDNYSVNYGVEGPTSDPAIREQNRGKRRA